MKKYKDNFLSFFKWSYFIPIILTVFGSYFYLFTHSTVNIDTLSYDRYYQGTSQLVNGRYLGFLMNKITNLVDFNPFFADFCAIILLVIAAVVFCTFIKTIIKKPINAICYTIFSCLFISYPLITEILGYVPSGINIGLGYIITFIALIYSYESISGKNNYVLIIILLLIAITLYESFASVYLLGLGIILLLNESNKEEKTSFKCLCMTIWKGLIPLLVSVVLNLVISKILFNVINDSNVGIAGKTIIYDFSNILGSIWLLIKLMAYSYLYKALYHLPITILVISIIIFGVIYISKYIKSKNVNYILLMIFSYISLFSLSLIQGYSAYYRTCQTFALFISFTFSFLTYLVLLKSKKEYLKKLVVITMFVLIFYQSKEIHKWAYLNDLRFQHEKLVIIDISQELQKNYDISKPIVFMGEYSSPEVVKKHMYKNGVRLGQSDLNSYIDWALTAFDTPGAEILKFSQLYGYNFKLGTMEMLEEAKLEKDSLKNYPESGYILEKENYIIVNF